MSGVFGPVLNTLFNDPNLSTSATYVSSAGEVVNDVRVLLTIAADAVVGAAATLGATAQHDEAEVLQSEVPARPARGAKLLMADGTAYTISEAAEPTKRGMTWRLVLADG